jgi:hypothetical protein
VEAESLSKCCDACTADKKCARWAVPPADADGTMKLNGTNECVLLERSAEEMQFNHSEHGGCISADAPTWIPPPQCHATFTPLGAGFRVNLTAPTPPEPKPEHCRSRMPANGTLGCPGPPPSRRLPCPNCTCAAKNCTGHICECPRYTPPPPHGGGGGKPGHGGAPKRKVFEGETVAGCCKRCYEDVKGGWVGACHLWEMPTPANGTCFLYDSFGVRTAVRPPAPPPPPLRHAWWRIAVN